MVDVGTKEKTDQDRWIEFNRKMTDFEDFLSRKLIKLEILMDDEKHSAENNTTHTNIGNVGTYVAGNSINISNVLPIYRKHSSCQLPSIKVKNALAIS